MCNIKMIPLNKLFHLHFSVWFLGYGMVPSGKSLNVGVLSPEQLHPAAAEFDSAAVHQPAGTQGLTPAAPQPTSVLVMVTQGKYQTLSSPVLQGKSYEQTPIIHEAPPAQVTTPGLELTPAPAPVGPLGKGPKVATSGPQSNPAPEPAGVLPEGKYTINLVVNGHLIGSLHSFFHFGTMSLK